MFPNVFYIVLSYFIYFITFHHDVSWCFSVSVMFGVENSKLALNGKTFSTSKIPFVCRQYPLMTSTCLLRGKRPAFDLTSVHIQTFDWYGFMVKLPGSGQCLRRQCSHADAGKCWYPWCTTGYTNHQGTACAEVSVILCVVQSERGRSL